MRGWLWPKRQRAEAAEEIEDPAAVLVDSRYMPSARSTLILWKPSSFMKCSWPGLMCALNRSVMRATSIALASSTVIRSGLAIAVGDERRRVDDVRAASAVCGLVMTFIARSSYSAGDVGCGARRGRPSWRGIRCRRRSACPRRGTAAPSRARARPWTRRARIPRRRSDTARDP